MFAHKIAKLAGTALVAGALGLAAVATAGTAGALSSADNQFLSDIKSEVATTPIAPPTRARTSSARPTIRWHRLHGRAILRECASTRRTSSRSRVCSCR